MQIQLGEYKNMVLYKCKFKLKINASDFGTERSLRKKYSVTQKKSILPKFDWWSQNITQESLLKKI